MLERLGDRRPPRIRAVVIAVVDLGNAAVADRPLDAHHVAIRREGDLRARHAPERPLLKMNLIRHGVGVQPRVRDRPAVLLRERRLARRHVEQPHLHDDAGPRLAHAAHHDTVGAKLPPPVERYLVDRRAAAESSCRCREGSGRTRARSSGRPTAPVPSSSPPRPSPHPCDSAMKSGTAYFGGKPGEPPIRDGDLGGLLRRRRLLRWSSARRARAWRWRRGR